MKTVTFEFLKEHRSKIFYLNYFFLCICLPIMFSAYNVINNPTQEVNIEASTIVLNPTENMAEASIIMNSDALEITSITFSVTFDNEVLQASAVNISGGAFNIINDNEILIALFSVSPLLTTINFDFIGAPGTQSPLNISIINIFDVNESEVSSVTNVIPGSISKTCLTNAVYGCTNDNYEEYNPTANCDDGSCATLLCPYDLYISGVPVIPGVYVAENNISSDGLINGGVVEYSAGNSLELMSGFEVMLGSEYNAIIEGCN